MTTVRSCPADARRELLPAPQEENCRVAQGHKAGRASGRGTAPTSRSAAGAEPVGLDSGVRGRASGPVAAARRGLAWPQVPLRLLMLRKGKGPAR